MICDYKWNSVWVCLCLLSSLYGCGPICFCDFCDNRCNLFDGVSASTQMCGELFQSVCEGLLRRADSFQTESKTVGYAAFGVGGVA